MSRRGLVPSADPGLYFRAHYHRLQRAYDRVFSSGRFILGEEVRFFERRFADYLGVEHCVGVASGTDAVTLALYGVGVRPGDEVITVSLTASGTGVGIMRLGALMRFVDVDPRTKCMDPGKLEEALTEQTRAVVVVHLHGHPAPMPDIMKIAGTHGIGVVEDCAQAHGASIGGRKVGGFGHAAAFSFYPTKNLGAPGDAGAVATNDPEVAERIRSARQYGWNESKVSDGYGVNSRLDEIHAAVLNELLGVLDDGNQRRRRLADRYRAVLGPLPVALPAPHEGNVYHQFVIETEEREGLKAYLREAGIGTSVHFAHGLHHQPAFSDRSAHLPVTDRLCRTMISLPIQPEIAEPHFDAIAEALLGWGKR